MGFMSHYVIGSTTLLHIFVLDSAKISSWISKVKFESLASVLIEWNQYQRGFPVHSTMGILVLIDSRHCALLTYCD